MGIVEDKLQIAPPALELVDAEAGLPVLGDDPCERADARRNREKILLAAERLFSEHGTEAVSMDAVAEAAGVGKGTLYRRFGDRSGLARAILDQRDREFQEQLIRGAPPLGPGADPVDRLIAFGSALTGLVADHGDLIIAAQEGKRNARFAGPVYATYRTHVRMLLQEINDQRGGKIDADYFADVLLAALDAQLCEYWSGHIGLGRDRALDGFEKLVRGVVTTSTK